MAIDGEMMQQLMFPIFSVTESSAPAESSKTGARGDQKPEANPPKRNTKKPEKALIQRPKTKLLENALRQELGPHTRLAIVDTRTTLLSQSEKKGIRTVRVHQLFLDAEPSFFPIIARYLRTGSKTCGAQIDHFIESQSHVLEHHVAPLPPNAHIGETCDLQPIFNDLNEIYFENQVRAELAWGQTGQFRGKKRRSIILGSYDSRAHRITIHPALDQEWVPRLCIARVVHHEMLHAVYPERKSPSGRRILHGPEFKRAEALFKDAKEADQWLDRNLDQLLRYRNSNSKSGRKAGQRSVRKKRQNQA